jgi:hypothetical protein
MIEIACYQIFFKKGGGSGHMVVGFIATYAISAYHNPHFKQGEW